ncbi:hypothetical protein BH11MYX3_BH11MYX3_30910 [soil metagenome]
MLPYRSVRDAAIADVGRAITMALGGVLAFVPIEYALTINAYAGHSTLASKVRLIALVVTLSLVLWLALTLGLAAILVVVRVIRAQIDPVAGRDRGWFVPRALDAGIRTGVPRVWAAVVTALATGYALQRGAVWAILSFKEAQLTGVLIGAMGIAALGIGVVVYRICVVSATLGARAIAPVLGIANPVGRWRAAGFALAALVGGALAASWFALPQSRSVLPVRLVISTLVVVLGMGFGAMVHPDLPRQRPRRLGLVIAGASTVLCTLTLAWWGADLETKYMAITGSPALDKLIGVVRMANDFDRDGFGTVLGEADCAPFDPSINGGAIDKPDDGIDQNCDGHDCSMASLVIPTGPKIPVPAGFQRPWNVLLITIDTVRYDHTSFGGYATSPKQRDTTPRLAELVKRSTSFTWTQAPSAGTMASIPAILTSKFFHSGIALDESNPKGTPPRIKPENTTLPEIMKRGGYHTGVIASHDWWNDWGLDQGVDDYDNSIGKTPDAYRVAADKVTDHILAWVSQQQGRKWFLWAHYIDPHGRYVAHPDVVDYGSKDEDLYDAELKWTDQEVGRLIDELRHLPSWQNTIIVITSDHGESMAEHNVPLGTHGTALYRELLHVPMIWYIPDNPAREVGGAVTNIDIVPTLAELCGIDVHDLSFEGISLVTQLFSGRADHDRIVFAETNAPGKQRAAISEAWKLIYYINSNVYELFDLKADPWEKTNLAPINPPSLEPMQKALQNWMDRVMYARDANFNQAYRYLADVVTNEPAPVATSGQRLANGAIEVAGIGPALGKPFLAGGPTEIHVYFTATTATTENLKFQVVLWPKGAALTDLPAGTGVRSAVRSTADGTFPTTRWKAGDHVRDRFGVTIPGDWKGEVVVGLVAYDAAGAGIPATGPTPTGEPLIAILGVLALGGSPEPPRP